MSTRARAAALLLLTAGSAPVLAQPPHAAFRPVGLAEARWTHGFWADRFATLRTGTLPALGRVMEGTERSQFLENFRVAAGMTAGRHRGPPWNDGDCYKWLEAAAATLAVAPDPEVARQVGTAVAVIARAQRADGYLHTPVLIESRNGDAAQPFRDRLNFETYNFGHLFTAACVHHRATGNKELLAVAVKAAEFLERAFQHPTPELSRHAVCPSHFMGLVDLHRATGEARYLRLAERLFALRDEAPGGSDDNQDRIPFRRQTEAVGHAVRANYLYAGAADLYAETGDRTLLEPLLRVWDSVARRKLYVTGGCGALYDGASPDGAKDQKQIGRVHQAYGRDFQLPNSTAHNETCAAVGNILWNWRMLQITGEARFADVLERSLYNAALAGVSLDGQRFFYTNTLRQLDRMPAALRWSRNREPFISCFCCPPNLARTVAEASTYAYGSSPDGVWVHLYGGSTLDTELKPGERFRLTQDTDYPWDGRVRLTVRAAPARPARLHLRVPGWAGGASFAVNGSRSPQPLSAGNYLSLERRWEPGDVIELELPLRVRLLEAHPLVEEARNQVAVQRGPVVYCLESCDLEGAVAVPDVFLPQNIEFSPRGGSGPLRGVPLLEGLAQVHTRRPWSDELYREFAPAHTRCAPVRLIPYFAWGNRGRSEMTVWMPLGH